MVLSTTQQAAYCPHVLKKHVDGGYKHSCQKQYIRFTIKVNTVL